MSLTEAPSLETTLATLSHEAELVLCRISGGSGVRSLYVRVEEHGIPLQNGVGYIYLPRRPEPYDVFYMGRGDNGAKLTIEFVDSAGKVLAKIDDTIANGKAFGLASFQFG